MRQRSFSTAVLLPIALLVAILAWTRDPVGTMVQPAPGTPVPVVTPVVTPTPVPKQVELVVFSAPWCGACRQIKAQIDQIEKSGIKVTRIDVDKDPQIALQNYVMSIPTMLIKACGQVRRTQNIDEAIKWIEEAKCATTQP